MHTGKVSNGIFLLILTISIMASSVVSMLIAAQWLREPKKEERIVNVIGGLVSSLSNWDVDPMNLQLATDHNYASATTVGRKHLDKPGTFGVMLWDLGVWFDNVEVFMKVMFGNTILEGAYGRVYVEFADDDLAFLRSAGYHSSVFEEWTQNQDHIQWGHCKGTGRYILVGWYGTGAGDWRGAMYEIKVFAE